MRRFSLDESSSGLGEVALESRDFCFGVAGLFARPGTLFAIGSLVARNGFLELGDPLLINRPTLTESLDLLFKLYNFLVICALGIISFQELLLHRLYLATQRSNGFVGALDSLCQPRAASSGVARLALGCLDTFVERLDERELLALRDTGIFELPIDFGDLRFVPLSHRIHRFSKLSLDRDHGTTEHGFFRYLSRFRALLGNRLEFSNAILE